MAHRPTVIAAVVPFRVAAFLVSLSLWIAGARRQPAHGRRCAGQRRAATSAGAVAPDAEKLFKAIVKVQVRAVPDARSSRERSAPSARAPASSSARTI